MLKSCPQECVVQSGLVNLLCERAECASSFRGAAYARIKHPNLMNELSGKREKLLSDLQSDAFKYFVNEVNPDNGLVVDCTKEGWPSSIAAVGMALSSYPVGVERKLITRDEAVDRTLRKLRFFANSEQSTNADATGYKGFYYHFLDMQTGKRARDSEISTIDSTVLIAGMLAA